MRIQLDPTRARNDPLHRLTLAACAAAIFSLSAATALAHERYNDGCQNCHGSFTGGVSPKGTTFPSNNKHTMHRSSSYMATNCNLCHRADDGRDPFLGSSTGTANNPGIGCLGCHGQNFGGSIGNTGAGLRRHHANNGVSECGTCHTNDPEPLPESSKPVYYGTPDTKCDDPCNIGPAFKENWSIGDTLGTDNDGDNIYDADDPDCSPCNPCDTNCDGSINGFDISSFVQALNGNPNSCSPCNSDTNGDGSINGFDIVGFVACLSP